MKTLEERFFSKVNKTKTCWVWTGCKYKSGYGKIGIDNKKTLLAHRLSYQIHYGDFDKNLFICHKCDNPSCVNPNHLFLGTPKDNMIDKVNKGRQDKGEKHPMSKLSENDIIQIKYFTNGLLLKDIAEKYNVSVSNISLIKNNKKWKHI